MSTLHALAREAGLQRDWTDALGTSQCVSDEALTAVLNALGLPADDEAAMVRSRALLADEAAMPAFVSADQGTPIRLAGVQDGTAELRLEDGSVREVVVEHGTLRAIETIGYHSLDLGSRVIKLAVAPARCFSIADAGADRIWAPAVQISGLREADGAFGDFGTLARAAQRFAEAGADAIAISPVHALFPVDADRISPYAPSSRYFLNIVYADPALAGGEREGGAGEDLIDWRAAIPARLAALRRAYDGRSDGIRDEVAAFAAAAGETLRDHARFDALHAHFFGRGARGWQDWPAEYHDSAGDAVSRFARTHADEVDFFIFAQWLAKRSLDAAQRAATGAGMALGLIADLAIGIDPGGSQAWSRPGDLLSGLTIGVPPDLLGPDGQGWGITSFDLRALARTGFAPFIATLRAALDHAGGIRIDHALGLHRLWVIPEGASPKDGAYLTMPQDDLLRILAIESQRAKAIVIGEDLGTVPEGLRPAMEARAMLGMRVLWFERDEDGGFVPRDRWQPQAAALTGTHDLATVAGWWRGRDIDWTWTLGRTSRAANEAEDRTARDRERTKLWQAFVDAGTAQGPLPDDAAPVVDVAIEAIAATPCALAIVPIEDLAGLVEQPNLPGTTDEHPNWRRRMPDHTDALLARPEIEARVKTLNTRKSA